MVITKDCTAKASKKSVSDNNETTDTAAPVCRVCNAVFVPPYKAIQCDKCSVWVHKECSDLSAEQFNFLNRKNLSPSIKWFCQPCESGHVQPDSVKNSEYIEKIATLAFSISEQNSEILQCLHRDRMIEERLKTNVTEVIVAQKEREDRKNNLVLFNIPENEDNDKGLELDKRYAADVCKFVDPEFSESSKSTSVEFKIERLGTRRKPSPDNPSPRPRPIKICFSDHTRRDRVLKSARKLKDSAYKHVGISADKTKEERDRDYLNRTELKRRKNEGEDVVLYRGDIILRSEAPWSKNNGNIYGAQRRAASGGGAGAAGKDHPSGGAAVQN